MEGVDDRGRAASDCGSRAVRSRRRGNDGQSVRRGRPAPGRRAPAWPFERGRRAVRARPRGSRGITACARAKRRVESGLGGCQAFLGRLHLAVDDRAQVIVLVTIIVTVIVIVVGLRRRARFAGACKKKLGLQGSRIRVCCCPRDTSPRSSCLDVDDRRARIADVRCAPVHSSAVGLGPRARLARSDGTKTKMLIVLSRDRVNVAR